MTKRLPARMMLVTVALMSTVAACTANVEGSAVSDDALTVVSTDDSCDVSSDTAPSGNLVFSVSNEGSQVTEFYLLADDALRVVGEVENIGPGLTRDLVVQVEAGSYFASCKPGMVGDGIKSDLTVIDSGEAVVPEGAVAEQLDRATKNYAAYVEDQADQLLVATESFAALYASGDAVAARAAYAPARVFWERIEPVAESFGDLDPRLDLREADLAPGQKWTGWHRIEKDLWPPRGFAALPNAQRQRIADLLVADTRELVDRIDDLTYTADQLGNGAKELLDEVATGKVTGEEEIWSHTDLWDFQANLDGARVAYEALRPVVMRKNTELARTLDARFDRVQAELDKYRRGDGFVLYTELSPAQVKGLAGDVDALGEPLSGLTALVLL